MGKVWSKSGVTHSEEEGSNIDPQPQSQTTGGGATGEAASVPSAGLTQRASEHVRGASGLASVGGASGQQASGQTTQDVSVQTLESSGQTHEASGHGESTQETTPGLDEIKDSKTSCPIKPKQDGELIEEEQHSTLAIAGPSSSTSVSSSPSHPGSPPGTPVRSKPSRSRRNKVRCRHHPSSPACQPLEPSSGQGYPPPPTSKPPELPPWARMRRRRKTKRANKIQVRVLYIYTAVN